MVESHVDNSVQIHGYQNTQFMTISVWQPQPDDLD